MTERVDIANMALSWLGEDEITALEDDSDAARQIKTNYIPARDFTLEAHDWTFAIQRFIPGKLEDPPAYGAGAYFTVPADCLRVVAVERNADSQTPWTRPIGSDEQIDWQFEGDKIICNEDVIYARGVFRMEEEGRFSPGFVMALAAQLAFLSAMSLTASAEIQANMLTLFDFYIKQAKSRDGLQGRSRRIRNRSLQKVR